MRRIASAFVVAIISGCVAAPAPPGASPTASPLSAVVATPVPSGRGSWIADTGIYGTYNHFGNPPSGPSFICGVGYNLSYDGGAPLNTVDVSVLFPDVFAAHVTPATVGLATGWQHPTMEINSPQIHDAAWLSRIGGAMGAVCQNGPGDMDSIHGSILKVSWTTAEGSYDQEFLVDTIRGEMTEFGMPDGRIRVCWAEPSRC